LRSNGHHPVREPERLDECQALEWRRLSRYEHEIRRHQRGACNRFDVRWPIDDRAIHVSRDRCQLAVKRVARDRYGEPARERLLRAQLRPLDGAGVGIGIDDGDAPPLASPDAGEMQRQGGLADSALLVEERDDHGVRSRMPSGFSSPRGLPNNKEFRV
jgi:hypothetical protein